MKNLIYYQKLQLRDKLCKITIDELSEENTWELQGMLLRQTGFNEQEAKYPSDTHVGVSRLKGFMDTALDLKDWEINWNISALYGVGSGIENIKAVDKASALEQFWVDKDEERYEVSSVK